MPGLEGSRWAGNVSEDAPVDNAKSKDTSKYVAVPSFGFQMPAFTPVKATPKKEVPAPAPVPTPEATSSPAIQFTEPDVPAKLTDDLPAEPNEVSAKQMSKAEIAGAKTRARMEEILGPRSLQGGTSDAKK